jgi:hypothetical protein
MTFSWQDRMAPAAAVSIMHRRQKFSNLTRCGEYSGNLFARPSIHGISLHRREIHSVLLLVLAWQPGSEVHIYTCNAVIPSGFQTAEPVLIGM